MNDFTFKLDIVKALDSVKSGDRIVVGYASSFDVDTDNTQITRQALEGAKNDLLTYSTVLFNHDVDRPIGKVIETDVDDVGLLVKVVISKEEDEIWKKIEEGIINKFSIKGRAFDLTPIEGENQILQINKIELFEVSLVSVPANKEAYTISHWIAKTLDIEKGVVPLHSPAKADENMKWDSTSAVNQIRKWASSDKSGDKEKIDWAKYATAFAWFDSGDKKNFGSYKLPHHDIVDGTFKVVWKGVAAAMAVLNGARGGVDVPDSAKRGIYSHLARHYKQFDKEVPEFGKSLEYIEKDNEETLNKYETNMKDLLEKLKIILSKENVEEVKKDLDSLIKDLEKEGDLIEKLQVVSGKLSGEDKEVVDSAIEMIKISRNKFKVDEPEEEKEEIPGQCNKYDLADESDTRPVFQLNKSLDSIELSDGNKFRKQVLKLGKWFHWDADGGVLNVTNDVIDNIIKNFKKSVIEHVYVPVTHTNDPTKNAGEVVELQKTSDGLDAVIEIKDETIVDKIKKGLIKCVSASLDPNYRVKTSNKFVGPTLLHTALVSEPYIKGMGGFVTLSEGFEGRNVIQLEDEQPNFFSVMKALKDSLEKIEDTVITSDVFAEEFANLKKEIGITKQIEEESEKIDEEVEEEKVEESKEEVEIEKENGEVEEKKEEEAVEEDKDAETEEEIEKKKKEHKVGDECTINKKKGKYVKDGEKLVCKELTKEELKELMKKDFRSCMSREMKAGKTMAEASKICKQEVKKELSEATSGEEAEDKSDKNDQQKLDFADAERVYEGYLKAGKIVPAQKDAFIKLMVSGKVLELGDNKVGVSELIKTFMESQKTSIDFEEEGVPIDDDEEKKEDKEETADLGDVPSDAKEFFGKMGISKDEDIAKSWKNLKDLKKEEEDEKSSLI
ncbi:MAG: HK97 family phage prohead protease [Methanogenium sp.]|jgi:HK97 family phage prohead protease